MSRLVLLGDSILDNAAYTGPDADTATHLRDQLGPSWSVELRARDGAVMADIDAQPSGRPDDADWVVLSVGGNDAVRHLDLLDRPASTSAEVLADLDDLAVSFGAEYDQVVTNAVRGSWRLAVCTIYEPPMADPWIARLARVPLTLLNDQIIRSASRRGLAVLDLRSVCPEPEDFVLEIEPSAEGAAKIAQAIAAVVRGEPVVWGSIFSG